MPNRTMTVTRPDGATEFTVEDSYGVASILVENATDEDAARELCTVLKSTNQFNQVAVKRLYQ
jgi:hypothetical protein